MRRLSAFGIAGAIALAACSPSPSPKKADGPVVAKGQGIAITEQDFKARLDEQSPFIRSRYTTLERKKEFLDNLIRFEVLAREAEKQGLAKDPDVQNTMKKIMVQKLVQKNFTDGDGAKSIPDAELQAYYDSHKSDYFRPRKVRLAAVVWNAPEGSPERAKDLAAAKKALAKLRAEEKKNALAFAQAVNEHSEDPATKAAAGDLNYKSQEELAQAYGKAFADAAFALKSGETSGVLEAPQGLYVVKATGEQQELNRPFDQVKSQIANKLFRERKTKEFDEWLKKLREEAKITVDDKALEAIDVAAAPPPAAGMPGMPEGHGMPPRPGAPAPAPVAPAAAPAPAGAQK
jgi:peptidyl-prolyl cis-trans isomerase C